MNIRSIIELTKLFGKITAYPQKTISTSACLEDKNRVTGNGTAYDIYSPKGVSSGCVIALHGMTIQGKDDSMLVNFARSIASGGVTCVVPILKGLSSGFFEQADIPTVHDIINEVFVQTGAKPGIIGFSFGGSYAIRAGSEPESSSKLNHIIAFGPYYSLRDVADSLAEKHGQKPSKDYEWDTLVYCILICVYGQNIKHGLYGDLIDEVKNLLFRYCDEADIEEKKRFYYEKGHKLDSFLKSVSELDEDIADALSLHGRIRHLRVPVNLVHDKNDPIIESSHSIRIHEDISRNNPDLSASLLVTTMLSHVSPANIYKIREIMSFYRAMEPLVPSYWAEIRQRDYGAFFSVEGKN